MGNLLSSMARRDKLIARSIVFALLTNDRDGQPAKKRNILFHLKALFRIYSLTFQLIRPDLFRALRGFWELGDEDYKSSFLPRSKASSDRVLKPMGDMGYSGSTFFRTDDSQYLVKSVPRRFENAYFKQELLLPYAEFMMNNPASLLVHIAEFLESTHVSIGLFFGMAPSHHIVMENLMWGQGYEERLGRTSTTKPKWENWDLKPTSYFFPERDVAGGMLASEATKSKLADKFEGKILLTRAQASGFRLQLEKDTQLLADHNAVDYSLFLVRISEDDSEEQGGTEGADGAETQKPPIHPPSPESWRSGVVSSDGTEVYRATVLDFFWAKHAVQAKAMTGLIKTYNVIDEQGPMSITAESKEYRDRFLKMCDEIVQVTDQN